MRQQHPDDNDRTRRASWGSEEAVPPRRRREPVDDGLRRDEPMDTQGEAFEQAPPRRERAMDPRASAVQSPARPIDPLDERPELAMGSPRTRPASDALLDDAPTTAIPREAAPGRHFLPETDRERFGRSWEEVQARFVDQPSEAVELAERLVRSAADRFCQALDSECAALSARSRDGAPATEDLRLAMQGYRSLLQRLITA